jgi:hypothetical protein
VSEATVPSAKARQRIKLHYQDMTHLQALQALCKRIEPEVDELVGPDTHDGDFDADAARTLLCKLYDAIMDRDECKP